MGCAKFGNRFFLKGVREWFCRLLDNRRFELLLVDPEQLIDFELDVLPDPQSLGVESLERREMKEDIFAEMLGSNETKLSICDQGDDLSNAHGGLPFRELADTPDAALKETSATLPHMSGRR
jgi:hypothetical protein